MRRSVLGALLCVVACTPACERVPVQQEPQRLSKEPVDLRYDATALQAHGMQAASVMEIVQRALEFHRSVWPGAPQRLDSRVHLFERWPENAERLITSDSGCTIVLALENIKRFANENREPLDQALEFAVAHEMAHCFQRLLVPNHREVAFSRQSTWLMEGTATWLARKLVTKQHKSNPSYFWEAFKQHHNQHLLTLANEAFVFFSYLESTWGLDGTSNVMALLTDPDMPKPTCHVSIALGPFPEAHSKLSGGDCAGEGSPFRRFLEEHLKKQKLSLKEVMSAYATTLARGEIRGAPPIDDFVRTVEILAKPASLPPVKAPMTPLVNGWMLVFAELWTKGFRWMPIAEWRLIAETERLDPLGVLLLRYDVEDVEVTKSLGGIWYGIETLGDSATVDITQTGLDGRPGTGLSWQFSPHGGVIVDRDVRPFRRIAGPSRDLQDLTDSTDDFTFAVTRTAIDDYNRKARIQFFKLCPPFNVCEVKQ
jgi:hypothetical protein